MPTAGKVGDMVALIGNEHYFYTKLPEGGTWYCSLSEISTVGVNGHKPITFTYDRIIATYKGGGSNVGNNLVIAYRVG